MAKKEKTNSNEQGKKTAGIFDFINGMTRDKKNWDSFSEMDKKAFSPYMVNRWLSMDLALVDMVNIFQQYTIGQLESREVYNLYSGILPKSTLYLKYVKGKKSDKYHPELVEFMKLYYNVSKSEIYDYLDIMMNTPEGVEKIIDILQKYGNDEKKIKKFLRESSS